MKWTRRYTLISGLALIGLANVTALGGAAYNRSGEPQSTLALSERELQPSREWTGRKENSGLTLHLQWRVLERESADNRLHGMGYGGRGTPAWLDESKMVSLGFDAVPPAQNRGEDRNAAYQRQLPREVFVVLELEGPAYRSALERAAREAKEWESKGERGDGRKAADERLDREIHRSSRLFAVDAGLDREALRSRFPDRAQYAVVRGQVRPMLLAQSNVAAGTITHLNATTVNVPLGLHRAFEGVAPDDGGSHKGARKRVDARLAFGQRLEPWLIWAAPH